MSHIGAGSLRLRGLTAGALCLGVLVGCVEERSFYIVQNQAPVASATGCTASSSAGGTYLGRGLLDVSLGVGYSMFPVLQMDIGPSEAEGVERNNFVLKRFEIGLDVSEIPGSFPSELTSFEYDASVTIRPGASVGAVVKVIPDELARRIQVPANVPNPTVVAAVQAVAVRLGSDSEIESTTFHFPIELCSGCLVRVLDVCPGEEPEGEEAPTYKTNACGLPQDAPLACCKHADGSTECLTQ